MRCAGTGLGLAICAHLAALMEGQSARGQRNRPGQQLQRRTAAGAGAAGSAAVAGPAVYRRALQVQVRGMCASWCSRCASACTSAARTPACTARTPPPVLPRSVLLDLVLDGPPPAWPGRSTRGRLSAKAECGPADGRRRWQVGLHRLDAIVSGAGRRQRPVGWRPASKAACPRRRISACRCWWPRTIRSTRPSCATSWNSSGAAPWSPATAMKRWATGSRARSRWC